MNDQTGTERAVSLFKDRRAWIPFALIGVLLLVVSTLIVVSVQDQQRQQTEPQFDEAAAFDQSEAAAQTALQTAVQDATTEVANEPVSSNASDPTKIEQALRNANNDASDVSSEIIFRNYMRLRVYMQASDAFENTGQQIRDTTQSAVSIPPIDPRNNDTEDIVEKLENVRLAVGRNDSTSLNAGKLRVTIEDVNITISQDNQVVAQRTTDVNATVATTLFELRNMVQDYENALERGFFSGLGSGKPSFGVEFAARVYPVTIAKSGLKWATSPGSPVSFQEIASNRQSEVLANHAIFSLQRQIFDTSDPESTSAMAGGTLCLAAEYVASQVPVDKYANTDKLNGSVAKILGRVANVSNDTLDTINASITKQVSGAVPTSKGELTKTVCRASRQLIGDQELELPSLTDFISGFNTEKGVADRKINITVEGPAALAYRMADGAPGSPSPPNIDNAEELRSSLRMEEIHPRLRKVESDESGIFNQKKIYESTLKEFQPNKLASEIDTVVDDIYEVETDALLNNQNFDGAEFEIKGPPNCDPGNWSGPDTTRSFSIKINDVTITKQYTESKPPTQEEFYRVRVDVVQEVVERETWSYSGPEDCSGGIYIKTSDASGSFTTTVRGEYSSGLGSGGGIMRAPDRELVEAYTDNGDDGPAGTVDNFAGIPERAVGRTFSMEGTDLSTDTKSKVESKVETRIRNNYSNRELTSLSDLKTTVGYDNSPDDFTPDDILTDSDSVDRWLADELEEMVFGYKDWEENSSRETYANDSFLGEEAPTVGPLRINRTKFLTSGNENLINGLANELQNKRKKIIYQDTSGGGKAYSNVTDMARAELYRRYVERLEETIDITSRVRSKKLEEKSGSGDGGGGLLSGLISGPLSEALNFAKGALGGGKLGGSGGEENTLEGSPLLDEVTFEVRGYPTYLALDKTTRAQSPAVRPPGGDRFAGTTPETLGDYTQPNSTKYSTLSAGYMNFAPYPGIPVLPPWFWAVSVSAWHVNVGGEYPRFAVTARTETPSALGGTTYIKENRSVALEFDGTTTRVGRVQPVDFNSTTLVVNIVPGSKPGIGDGGGLGGGSGGSGSGSGGSGSGSGGSGSGSGDSGSGSGGSGGGPGVSSVLNLFVGCQGDFPYEGPAADEVNKGISDGSGDLLQEFNNKVPLINPIPNPKKLEATAVCIENKLRQVLGLSTK
jgi:hypothetical protein